MVRSSAFLAVLLSSALFVPGASAAQAPAPAKIRYARAQQACPAPAPGRESCFALVRVPVASGTAAAAGALPYELDDGASSSGPSGGLTPAQLASAYGYEGSTGGGGQTVAIVDAYDDPRIEADLASFDGEYGLPACTEANGCFEKVGQTGSTTSLPAPDTSGWSVEISLDVETVHSVCPKCKILLVEGNQPTYEDLADAVDEAVDLGATEVSNSYGGPEEAMHASEEAAYDHPGIVIAASTGDDGYYDYDKIDEFEFYNGKLHFGPTTEMPNVPASLPSVLAVGGTTLELDSEGRRASESVWDNNGRGDAIGLEYGAQGASGGGCSRLFTAQPWQRDVPGFSATGCGSKRLSADIAADANPNTGFDVYDSDDCGSYCESHGLGKGWLTIGGTSLSAPLITALYGLAGGSDGVAYPSLTLYGHLGDPSSLFDVKTGANGFCDGESVAECGDPNGFFGVVDCEGTTACNAALGFDGPTGVGTPAGLSAFEPLLPSATFSTPAPVRQGTAMSFSASGSSDPYPGGSLSSYSWSWGDGTEGSGASPEHTYTAPGEYQVTLTITDSYGLTSQAIEHTVTVTEETLREKEEEAAAAKRREEEAAAKKRLEEEAAAKRRHEEEAAATKRHEEEAAATKRREEEAAAASRKREEQAAGLGGSGGVAGFQAQLQPAVPDALLVGDTLQASASGLVTFKISCPSGESLCAGTLTLRTMTAVTIAGKRAVLSVAVGSFTVAGGEVKTFRLRLPSRARTLLEHERTLRLRATIVAHDTAGATHTSQAVVLLREPRARAGH